MYSRSRRDQDTEAKPMCSKEMPTFTFCYHGLKFGHHIRMCINLKTFPVLCFFSISPTVKFPILILLPIKRLFNSNLMILTLHTTFNFQFCLSYTQLPPNIPFPSIIINSCVIPNSLYAITTLIFLLVVTPLSLTVF